MKRRHDCGSHAAVLPLKSGKGGKGFVVADNARDGAALGSVGSLALRWCLGSHGSGRDEFVNHADARRLDRHVRGQRDLDNDAAVAVDLDNHEASHIVASLQAFAVLHNVALVHFGLSVSGESRPWKNHSPSLVTRQPPSANVFGGLA